MFVVWYLGCVLRYCVYLLLLDLMVCLVCCGWFWICGVFVSFCFGLVVFANSVALFCGGSLVVAFGCFLY